MASDFQIPAPLIILPRRRQNSPLTPFLEPDGDPLMYRNVANIARNLNAFGNSLQQINDRVSRCERRAGIQDDLTQVPIVGPFSVYNPGVANGATTVNTTGTGYVVGTAYTVQGGTVAPGGQASQVTASQVDASGNLLSCYQSTVGSYTTPPTYPATLSSGSATVTILDATSDAYHVVQVRSGVVSARSQFSPYGDGSSTYPVVGGFVGIGENESVGNSEWPFGINTDGNLANQYAQQSIYPSGEATAFLPKGQSVVILNGYLPDGTNVFYTQIAVDPLAAVDGQISAAIWIEIIDDTSRGFYANLCGWTFDPSLPVPTFPEGTNIIPIAQFNCFTTASGFVFDSYQVIAGNITNRWPSMSTAVSTGLLTGLPEVWRGFWSANSLSGQYFYPGDVVVDDTQSYNVSGVNVYQKWQYTGYAESPNRAGAFTITTPPHSDATRWQVVGNQIVF